MATITCVRCEREAEALSEPPLGGQLGQTVQSKVCAACYNEWANQARLYINHYGLQMADPEDRKQLNQAMKEFLNLNQPA